MILKLIAETDDGYWEEENEEEKKKKIFVDTKKTKNFNFKLLCFFLICMVFLAFLLKENNTIYLIN